MISKFRNQPLSNAHSIKYYAIFKIDQLWFNFCVLPIKHLWSSFKSPINCPILKLHNSCELCKNNANSV